MARAEIACNSQAMSQNEQKQALQSKPEAPAKDLQQCSSLALQASILTGILVLLAEKRNFKGASVVGKTKG